MATVQQVVIDYSVNVNEAVASVRQLSGELDKSGKVGTDAAKKVVDGEKQVGDTVEKTGTRVRDSRGRFIKANKDAGDSIKKVTDGERGLSRQILNTDKSIASLSSGLKKLAGAVGIAFTAQQVIQFGRQVLTLTSNIEENFSQVENLVGVTGAALDELRVAVADVSVQTGQSQESLSSAIFAITSAGLRGKEAIDVLTISAKASTLGLGETREVALALGAVIQAYGAENISAAKAADVLAATVKEGNLEASSLAPVLGRVVGIAAQAGVSFDELGANIAAYTRLGVSAEEATTGLRSVITAIIRPSAQASTALASIGLTSADLQQKIGEQGLAKTLVELVGAFDGNTEALSRVIPDVQGLANLLGVAGEQGEEYIRIAQSIAETQGLVEEGFLAASNTLKNQFNVSVALAQKAILDLTAGAGPGLTDLISRFNELGRQVLGLGSEQATGPIARFAQKIRELFDRLAETTRELTVAFRVVADSVVTLLKNLGLIDKEASTGGAALQILETIVNQLANGISLLGDVFIQATAIISASAKTIRETVEQIGDVFNGLGRAINLSLSGQFREAANAINSINFQEIGNTFSVEYQRILDSAKPVAKEGGEELGEEAASGITDVLAGAGPQIGEAIGNAVTSPETQAALDAAFRELQLILDAREFKLKFGIDPGAVFLIEEQLRQIVPIASEGINPLQTLEDKIVDFGKVRDKQSAQSIQNIEDEAAEREAYLALQGQIATETFNLFQTVAQIQGEQSEAARAFAFLQVGLNQAVALSAAIKQAANVPFPGNIPAIISSIAAITSFFVSVRSIASESVTGSFAVGTSNAPGGLALVGEEGPEIMQVPKGARIFTADASKKERPLIEAINRGNVTEYINRVYVTPALLSSRSQPVSDAGGVNVAFDDFALRQAIKSNKVVKLDQETISQLRPRTIRRYR